MSRASMREVRVGLVVLAGLIGLIGLVGLASGGPGFLTSRRTIDVVFRDGQGIRVGCPVRVAGIDAGRVTSVDLAPVDGILRARVRLAIPAEIADRLRQDVKITIEAGLTGQSTVNIVSSGLSSVALVPGQLVQGVESSFFDPILEQLGLGPVERSHLSHTIAEVRQTVDTVGPRLRQILTSLQETATGVRETMAAVQPRVESTVAEVEGLVKRIDDAKFADGLDRLHNVMAQLDAAVAETRPTLAATLSSLQRLAAEVDDLTRTNRPQVESLLTGLNQTRARADAVLADVGVIADNGAQIATQNRADIERILGNVRDATNYGLKLVQKLYGNPFYLSPFYKPKPEDIRAQDMYDAANTFLMGAKEFSDALKTLQAMQGKAQSKQEREAYVRLFQRAWELTPVLNQAQRQLSEGLRENTPIRR